MNLRVVFSMRPTQTHFSGPSKTSTPSAGVLVRASVKCGAVIPPLLSVLLALSLAQTPPAEAAPAARTPYAIGLLPHGIGTGAAFAVLGVMQIVFEELPGGLSCTPAPGQTRCDPSGLNDLDRSMVGNNSREWRTVSDSVVYSTIGLSALALSLDVLLSDTDQWTRDLASDALVVCEATAVTLVLTQTLKVAVRRPRPTHYTPGAPVFGFDQQLSFPSGHTSVVAAVSVAYATTFGLRHPDSPWRFAVYGGALGLTVVTGLARVFGGRHFYTDVLAGAVIGAASGFLIPYWHMRAPRLGVTLALQPTVSESGAGVVLGGLF
jgi:membrane-associated phospholipid phosphatase